MALESGPAAPTDSIRRGGVSILQGVHSPQSKTKERLAPRVGVCAGKGEPLQGAAWEIVALSKGEALQGATKQGRSLVLSKVSFCRVRDPNYPSGTAIRQ